MTSAIAHEAEVRSRFNALEARFKTAVAPRDERLRAVLATLGPVAGRRVLDLGCGKGRFAVELTIEGASVVGVDLSASMLSRARGCERVVASARRLPLASRSMDSAIAIEVFEHIHPRVQDEVLRELARVLRPGGKLAIVDKNAAALDAKRPWLPSLLIKAIDERRGLWMYRPGSAARERWFWPGQLENRLRRRFIEIRREPIISPAEAAHGIFRLIPSARALSLWSARTTGGSDE